MWLEPMDLERSRFRPIADDRPFSGSDGLERRRAREIEDNPRFHHTGRIFSRSMPADQRGRDESEHVRCVEQRKMADVTNAAAVRFVLVGIMRCERSGLRRYRPGYGQ